MSLPLPEYDGLDGLAIADLVRRRDLSAADVTEAALATMAHLGGVWEVLATLGRLVPRPVRDAAYDLIARRRFEIAAPACLLPTPSERSRFLP